MFSMPRLRHNTVFRIHTPAKLNLSLEVLGRRPDGFHELRTVMSAVRLYDTLLISPTGDTADSPIDFGLVASSADPAAMQDIPTGSDNLVVRALELLREAGSDKQTRAQQGLKVRLVKRIPSQAGLGGGSSDAGAALVLGNRAWGLGLSTAELSEIGAQLGSDVPFFVHMNQGQGNGAPINGSLAKENQSGDCRAALCEGRGEKITPLKQVGGIPCVIIKPDVGLSTAAVYQATEEADFATSGGNSEGVAQLIGSRQWRNLGNVMGNALQAAAMRVGPSLKEIPQRLGGLPLIAHQLSGSGSAYFALCRSMREARRIATILQAHNVGQLYVTNTC